VRGKAEGQISIQFFFEIEETELNLCYDVIENSLLKVQDTDLCLELQIRHLKLIEIA
jgi:hypothetical protein